MSSFLKKRVLVNPRISAPIPKKLEVNNEEKSKDNALRLYCIYLPQFHSTKENYTNFYPGFTDILNLEALMNNQPSEQHLSPSLKDLQLNKISDYDLIKNKDLVSRQLKLLENYNIDGFAIYYYWFSNNTVSNNKMLMKEAIDNFFDESVYMYDRKVYFIWANENWHGTKSIKIENKYDDVAFSENITNLMNYFKSVNYLKINNKPVLFIYHPQYMTINELIKFNSILEFACKKNGFAGINIVLNNSHTHHKGFLQFNTHASKSLPFNGDFESYVDSIAFKHNIQAINFDFDNSARMFKPVRDTIIKYNNVTELSQRRLLNKVVNYYKNTVKNPVENILLINAWNNWGEQMAVEPSEQKGFYFLDLIKELVDCKNTNYSRYVNNYNPTHRGGWKDVYNEMDKTMNFSYNNNKIFYDCLDLDFLFRDGNVQKNPWIGILHTIPTKESIKKIFEQSPFLKSLNACRGLITLAPNLTAYCKLNAENIPVYTLKHPIVDINVPLFSYEAYINNKNKKIIQIGQQDRHISSICIINTPSHKKLWLTGDPDINEMVSKMEKEAKELNRSYTPIDTNFLENYKDYDELLTNNIVFLDLSAAVANNTVLECIIRNTPLLVNKIGGVPFYLGEEYPLYYNNYDDIPKILNDKDKILKAHLYLKDMDKSDISIDHFIKELKIILETH